MGSAIANPIHYYSNTTLLPHDLDLDVVSWIPSEWLVEVAILAYPRNVDEVLILSAIEEAVVYARKTILAIFN